MDEALDRATAVLHQINEKYTMFSSVKRENDRLGDELKEYELELVDSKNTVNIDRLQIMSLDTRTKRYSSMRKLLRFAIIATLFTTMIVYLGVRRTIHMSMCVLLTISWWIALAVVTFASEQKYVLRDRIQWNKFLWNSVLSDSSTSPSSSSS